MFYISINKNALEKIKKEAKSTDREIIGVLIGKVYDNLLVVNEAVSGEQASGLTRVKLDNSTIAKIVNDIMSGKLEGNILGWYHSHPGFGVFMSPTDVGTQEALEQFSKKIAALVIDPKEDTYGIFTLDAQSAVVNIPDEQVYLFGDGEDGIPPELKEMHEFKAKLEIIGIPKKDRIRYLIQCTRPYWLEKTCMVCGSELEFNEVEQIWYCPKTEEQEQERSKEAEADDEKTKTGTSKVRKFQKVHMCKSCNFSLRYNLNLYFTTLSPYSRCRPLPSQLH